MRLGSWILELAPGTVRKFLVGFFFSKKKVQMTVNTVYSVNYFFMYLFFIGFFLPSNCKQIFVIYTKNVNSLDLVLQPTWCSVNEQYRVNDLCLFEK